MVCQYLSGKDGQMSLQGALHVALIYSALYFPQTRSNAVAWNPMEAFNFTVANEDCKLYTYDMRKLATATCLHKVRTCFTCNGSKEAHASAGSWGVCNDGDWQEADPWEVPHACMHACMCIYGTAPCASQGHSLCLVRNNRTKLWPSALQDFVSAVMDVDYAPTGREFVAGGYDRSVRIFAHNGGHSREVIPPAPAADLVAHQCKAQKCTAQAVWITTD